MKTLFFLILLFITLFSPISSEIYAAELTNKQKIALIEPIEHQAMIYGDGEKKVYVFVDPKCPHSRDFISMLYENEKMRSVYRYSIFFYELKRFNSHNLIATIYNSSEPMQKTLEVMVGGKEIPSTPRLDPKIEAKIDTIADVADKIGVSKRPYLIIVKKLD
jgi:hypothetical protein